MNHRVFWCQAAGSAFLVSVGLVLSGAALSGCGGGSSEKSATPVTNASNGAAREPGVPVGDRRGNDVLTANDREIPHGYYTDKQGNKFFHKIPVDIFYEDPLTVGDDKRPVGGAAKPVAKIDDGKKPPMTGSGTDPKVPPAGNWATLASGPILDAEVKRIRNFTTQKMQTLGRYNGSYKEIQYNASALSAIAHIIAQHPDKVSWQADALYVRDLGTNMANAAIGLSKKNYDATKEPFEKIVDILNRNKPAAGLKKPEKNASFPDFVDRANMMKRMKSAYNWMKTDVTAEEKFKTEAEQVTHEATILGLLAKVAGDEGYDRADEPEYKDHVNETVKASQDIVKAAKTSDYASFRSALDRIGNRCNQCHTNYKNN